MWWSIMYCKSENACINTCVAARLAQHLLCSLWSPQQSQPLKPFPQRTWHLCIQRTWEGPRWGWMWSLPCTKNMSPTFSCCLHRHIGHISISGERHLLQYANHCPSTWDFCSVMPRQLPTCGIHPHIYEVLWEASRAACRRSPTGLHLVQVDKQDVISTQLSQLKNNSTFVWMLLDSSLHITLDSGLPHLQTTDRFGLEDTPPEHTTKYRYCGVQIP